MFPYPRYALSGGPIPANDNRLNYLLTVERINKHIERLEKMRKYANLHGDKRTFLGAVAGVVASDEARNYALNQGFFVIEPSGENLNITPPKTLLEW